MTADEAMASMERTRAQWQRMTAAERADVAHEAINLAVIALEEAARAHVITDAGKNDAILMLGVSCARLHDGGHTT